MDAKFLYLNRMICFQCVGGRVVVEFAGVKSMKEDLAKTTVSESFMGHKFNTSESSFRVLGRFHMVLSMNQHDLSTLFHLRLKFETSIGS